MSPPRTWICVAGRPLPATDVDLRLWQPVLPAWRRIRLVSKRDEAAFRPTQSAEAPLRNAHTQASRSVWLVCADALAPALGPQRAVFDKGTAAFKLPSAPRCLHFGVQNETHGQHERGENA